MAFTVGNVTAMADAMKKGLGALLAPQSVDLYQGSTVTVKLHVGTRRANESDITGGAVDDTNLIATIDADDWNAKAGRPPQKGDVIHWAGLRYAVVRSSLAAPAGVATFYKARLTG